MAIYHGRPRRRRRQLVIRDDGSVAAVGEPEKQVQHEIVRALRSVGYHVTSTSQARPSRVTEGMPDLFVAHPAWRVFAWLEVKAATGRLSRAQQEWHAMVSASGCPVLVVRGAADALELLEQLRQRQRHEAEWRSRTIIPTTAPRSSPSSITRS